MGALGCDCLHALRDSASSDKLGAGGNRRVVMGGAAGGSGGGAGAFDTTKITSSLVLGDFEVWGFPKNASSYEEQVSMTRSSSSNSITGFGFGFGLRCFGCFGCLGATGVFRSRFAGTRSTVGTAALRRTRGRETCRSSSSESSESMSMAWHRSLWPGQEVRMVVSRPRVSN